MIFRTEMNVKQAKASLFVSASLLVLLMISIFVVYDVTFFKAFLYSALAITVQLFTWQLTGRQGMISHSLALLPSYCLLLFICRGGVAWAWVSGALVLAHWGLYSLNIPESRDTTQAWVASAIYLILSALVLALIR